MVSEQIIKIILKAEDLASQQTDKIKDKLKGLGDTAKRAHEIASKSAERYKNNVNELDAKLNKTIDNVNKVGNEGSKSFRKLSKEEQDAVVKFNTLNEATQTTLTAIREVGVASANMFPDGNRALTSFSQLDNLTKSWAGSLEYAKTKMSLLGNDTTTLRGKIQGVGNAIPMYLGTKWEGLKPKVSSFGNFIKSNLSSALSSVRSKIDSLGSAFSGLGGIISSAIGGLGMASLTQMTVGLAMNRERMTALTSATMGSAEAGKQFVDVMDDLTNTSLVSLDDLGQAMSTIKMSTGMTNDQLKEFTTTVNDVGQRAILMGKSGDEAMSLMQAAGRGLNGEFDMLKSNFGITKEQLMDLGWSGAADDVKGYQDALTKALEKGGSMNGMMDTSVGHLESLKKNFRVAGRHVGEMFTPYIDQAVQMLNNLNDTCPGLFENLVMVAGAASGFATIAPSISPALQVFDMLTGKTKSLLVFLGLMKGAEDALTLSTLSETIAQHANTVAKAAGSTATVVMTGATNSLTASLWAMTTAVLANPWTWLVVALVAVAVAVYEVGKQFGWWKDIPSMLSAVWTGINRLWQAFINNPNVKGFIQDLGKAWDGVCAALQPVFDWAKKTWNELFPPGANFDIVRSIIDIFGAVGRVLGDVVNGIKIMYAKFGLIGAIVGIVSAPIQTIVGILRLVICALLGCSPGIVPALEKVQEVFMTVWSTIAGFIGGLIETVVAAIQPIIDILTQITDFYLSTFIFAWQTLVMVFNTVMVAVNQIIMIFSMFLSGQINLSTMLTMIWTTVSNMFASVLNIIISRVRSWASSMISRAIAAGQGFVNGIISFIIGLPGKVASILANVLSRIISAGSQWVSNARSKASAIVSGVISQITQLPGKVGQEFMNIGSRMLSEGSQLIEKAKQIGKNIVDGLLGAMGIHSPGIIQTKVVQEFEDMTGRVEDQIEPAGEVAKTFGETMVNQFGDVSLTPDLGYTDLDTPEMNMNVGMDSSMVSDTNSMVTSSYDALASTTGAALQTMVEQDRLAYESIRNNDATQLSAINTDVQMKMNMIGSKVNTSINSMVNKNQTGLTSARNTTQTQLTNITNATVKANNNMISSWNTMKDGIVSAANKIKSDSTKHFDALSSTIGTFYGKLKNPSRWGAGPGNGRVSGVTKKASSSTSGVGRINRAIKKMGTKYLTLGQVKQNPLLDYPNFGDYIIRGDNNRYDLGQLVKYGALTIPIGIGAGGWEDTVPSHVSLIKNTSREWDMSSPNIGRYSTSAATFKVKEFENGAPQIAYDTFRQLAEEVFSQTQYEFYYDDDHHGNWLNAFNAASMNCKHGAEALIAMAGAMGLSGHMVHGHWNEFGHYWASIEGHKMDVTGWQNRRTWTPSASAGPAPKSASYSISDLFSELKTSIENQSLEPVTGEFDEIQLGGSVTIVHEFLNLPPNIDEEEVARIVNETSTDDSWIKKLVQNRRFQKWDLKEKARLNGRDARARGV